MIRQRFHSIILDSIALRIEEYSNNEIHISVYTWAASGWAESSTIIITNESKQRDETGILFGLITNYKAQFSSFFVIFNFFLPINPQLTSFKNAIKRLHTKDSDLHQRRNSIKVITELPSKKKQQYKKTGREKEVETNRKKPKNDNWKIMLMKK